MDMKKIIFKNFGFLLLVLFILTACEKTTFDPVVITDASFKVDIQAILNNNCTSCHPPTKGLDLTSGVAYDELVPAFVSVADSANPEESKLYKKLIGTSHLPRTSDVEKQKFIKWISLGAPNN